MVLNRLAEFPQLESLTDSNWVSTKKTIHNLKLQSTKPSP